MEPTILFKGVDITEDVTIEQYIHDSYAEQHADTLLIKFLNSEGMWDKWNPELEDEIEIINGTEKTGIMFVKEKIPEPGYYTLRASSTPQIMQIKRSGSWENVTFLQIAQEIAARNNMILKKYSIQNQKYSFVAQNQERDLDFLENLCVLEGCAFIIFDKSLILYQEEYLESQDALFVEINGQNNFYYSEEMLYSGCEINNGDVQCVYVKDASYEYIAQKDIKNYITSKAEAERFAKNMLKFLNKNQKKGYFYTNPIAEGLTAGSVVNINTEDTEGFDGKIFLTRVRHDYKKGQSKVFFRKVVE